MRTYLAIRLVGRSLHTSDLVAVRDVVDEDKLALTWRKGVTQGLLTKVDLEPGKQAAAVCRAIIVTVQIDGSIYFRCR